MKHSLVVVNLAVLVCVNVQVAVVEFRVLKETAKETPEVRFQKDLRVYRTVQSAIVPSNRISV